MKSQHKIVPKGLRDVRIHDSKSIIIYSLSKINPTGNLKLESQSKSHACE